MCARVPVGRCGVSAALSTETSRGLAGVLSPLGITSENLALRDGPERLGAKRDGEEGRARFHSLDRDRAVPAHLPESVRAVGPAVGPTGRWDPKSGHDETREQRFVENRVRQANASLTKAGPPTSRSGRKGRLSCSRPR